MSKGNLIVIEGACDGIGKSTQYNLLKKSLVEDGKIITSHHFPSFGATRFVPVTLSCQSYEILCKRL